MSRRWVAWPLAGLCLVAWVIAMIVDAPFGGLVHLLPVSAGLLIWMERREPPGTTSYSRWLRKAGVRR